jgi:hypothetical protein
VALFTTLHFHNLNPGREADVASWFDGKHREALAGLRGLAGADRYEVTPEQLMVDIVQPWRFCSVYDFDTEQPEIDLPSLGSLLAGARDAGLIRTEDDSERIFTYRLYGDWNGSANWQRDKPLSGISVLIGNYIPGRYDEYMDWYGNVHSPEVAAVPGHVAMKRGQLSEVQIEPRRYCPGDQLVYVAQQTDNLAFTIRDMGFRAMGRSPSGIAMAPRSSSGSLARTVHYFKKVSGTEFWSGGIAYDGDLSMYPEGYGRE